MYNRHNGQEAVLGSRMESKPLWRWGEGRAGGEGWAGGTHRRTYAGNPTPASQQTSLFMRSMMFTVWHRPVRQLRAAALAALQLTACIPRQAYDWKAGQVPKIFLQFEVRPKTRLFSLRYHKLLWFFLQLWIRLITTDLLPSPRYSR